MVNTLGWDVVFNGNIKMAKSCTLLMYIVGMM